MNPNPNVKFTDYNGIEVFVDQTGDFVANVNGCFLRQATYAALLQRINHEKTADAKATKLDLPCYGFVRREDHAGTYPSTYLVVPLQLVGINRNDSSLKWRGLAGIYPSTCLCPEARHLDVVEFALPATAENLTTLQELATAKTTYERLTEAIKHRRIESLRYGGHIQPSEYAEALKRLAERYQHCLKKGAHHG